MTHHDFFARLWLVVILVTNMNTAISTTRKERLSQILQSHRTKCGTMKELARLIGIKPGTLSTYIQGDSYPDWLNLGKIAAYLGMRTEDLDNHLSGWDDAFAPKRKEGKPLKAEEFFPMILELPAEEKIALARYLLNAAS